MKASALKRLLKIYILRLKASVMGRMAYPANFYILTLATIVQTWVTIIFIQVIYGFVKNISGWSYDQALLVVASYLLVEGLMWISTGYLSGLRRNIKGGSFDIFLIQPINTLFSVSTWRIDPEDIVRVLMALAILLIQLRHYSFAPVEWFGRITAYVFFILMGYVIYYSLAVIINSLYFWFTEASNLHQMFEFFMRSGQYPTDIFYGKIIKIALSTIMPLAFLATVPARVFAFGVDYKFMFYAAVLAVVFAYIAQRVWHAGLKVYSSASS